MKFTKYDHNNNTLHSFCLRKVTPYAYSQGRGCSVAVYKTEAVIQQLEERINRYKNSPATMHKKWVANWRSNMKTVEELENDN